MPRRFPFGNTVRQQIRECSSVCELVCFLRKSNPLSQTINLTTSTIESRGWTITKMYLHYLNVSMPQSTHRPQFPMAGLAADPSDRRVARTGPRSPLCGHLTLRILRVCHRFKGVIQSSLPLWVTSCWRLFLSTNVYLNTPDFISGWGFGQLSISKL